jgi:hypothetical protein
MSIVNESPNDVEIRTSHLEHEASIRGIGLLYYFVSSFMFVTASLLAFISFMAKEAPPLSPLQLSWVLIFLSALGIFYWTLARGIRRLHRWIRIPSTILSLIGLVGIPLGTLINGYILYLLHSKKGVTVFSPEYKRIIAETPQVAYKSSRGLVLVALILVGGFLAFVAFELLKID